ncbi:hypothetical protein ACFWMP_14155 [Paenibacillus sp. NPDC058367]|uniref:hypothetical protein n=1 Tax=Paenibacillus sp. NPDC058367 TaxID=3346460 RepID=UPI003651AAC4
MSGFIQIGRELQNHWVRRDKDYWNVFCEMYFIARYSDKPEKRVIEGIEVTVHHKEFIFGRTAWSNRLDISERRLRTFIKKMVEEGFIKQVAKHSKFTVYSFEYALSLTIKSDQQNDQHNDQQDFTERPAEPLAPQGFEGDSDQQDFSKRPAERPAERPQKEEGIKEEGSKEECFKPLEEEQDMRKYTESFVKFWSSYPNKKGKAKASVHWNNHVEPELKKGNVSMDEIIKGTSCYVDYCQKSGRALKSGDTAVNHEVWQDDWTWNGETYGDARTALAKKEPSFLEQKLGGMHGDGGRTDVTPGYQREGTRAIGQGSIDI